MTVITGRLAGGRASQGDRHPHLAGLGSPTVAAVLVAGMAFHNLVLMLALRAGVPGPIVRVAQSWKEVLVALAAAFLAARGLRAWREGRWPRLIATDFAVAAYTCLLIIYTFAPSAVGLLQKALALRTGLFIPLLYVIGRGIELDRRHLVRVTMIVGAAASVVAAVGVLELWFMPTSAWVDLGANRLSAWFGYSYAGPGGLPENFWQTLSSDRLLRRMVSTYVSPLPIAYTGLLVVPLLAALWGHVRAWRIALMLALVLASIGLSVTRLALAVLVIEAILLVVLLRTRASALLLGGAALTALFAVLVYPHVGPMNDRDLGTVRQAAGAAKVLSAADLPRVKEVGPASAANAGSSQVGGLTLPVTSPVRPGELLSPDDPSYHEHSAALGNDLSFLASHPFGAGVGSFRPRFLNVKDIGESAVLGQFVELGIAGGLVFVAMYGLGLLAAWRALKSWQRGAVMRAVPTTALVGGLSMIPITLTSDVWSDYSVTFLLWWAFGAAARQAARAEKTAAGGDPAS